MRVAIELSCDLGEAEGAEGQRVEEEMWRGVDAANVACGGHAGDAASMREAAARAVRFGVVLGAHPSYPDRAGFGRRMLAIDADALRESLIAQIEALRAAAADEGAAVRRVKPHGALYNDADADRALAEVIVDAAAAVDPSMALVASPGSAILTVARERGLPSIREAFADRRYAGDGSLLPRSREGALLLDPTEAAAQAVRLALEGTALAADGLIAVEFDTLCVHGDMEGAVGRLAAIRSALAEAGLRSLSQGGR